MGRLDTRFRKPPVQISRANAVGQQDAMTYDASRLARGAGGFGQREARNGSIPVRLIIQKSGGPNTQINIAATLPINNTVRKRGYPPIVLPEEA
jgi:hypothetical protein